MMFDHDSLIGISFEIYAEQLLLVHCVTVVEILPTRLKMYDMRL